MEDNKQILRSENILLNEYSRHTASIGIEVMQQIMKKNILVYGLRGLGSEIVKNSVLVGPKSLYISDKSIVTIRDLGSNFYLSPEDVESKYIDEAMINKIRKLNPNTNVEILETNINFDDDSKYEKLLIFDVIVITKYIRKETLIKINKFTREHNKGLIVAYVFGLFSTIFVDYGENFRVFPIKQGESQKFKINSIKLLDGKILQVEINNCTSHSLSDNGKVTFSKIQKREFEFMNDLTVSYNKYDKYHLMIDDEKLIEQLSNLDILLTDVEIFEGLGEIVKTSIYNFLPFNISAEYVQKLPSNYLLDDRHEIIHICFMTFFEFEGKLKRPPDENSETDKEYFLQLASEIFDKFKLIGIFDEFLEEDIPNFDSVVPMINLFISKYWIEIPSISSFIGGIVSNEIFKFFGRDIPIFQWLRFDFLHLLDQINSIPDNNIKNDKYSDIISMFGKATFEKISKAKIFLIGAGAIGSEILKILALMGAATDEKGIIYVADYDNIELSNLNRQFLFDRLDISKPKSKVACQKIKIFNPLINIVAYSLEVSDKTESTFSQKFWKELDYVILAVDSNKARYYIDDKVVEHNLICFETGIDGFQGSCQNVIPYLSISIRDRPREEEGEVPACTIHSFPYKIEHVIQYSKENIFLVIFHENINNINYYFYNREKFFNRLNDLNIPILQAYQDMLKILYIYEDLKNKASNEKLIEYAIETFNRLFYTQINDLIEINPKNKLNEDGSLFWSGNKIFPSRIEFDTTNHLHKNFVLLFLKIFYKIFNLEFKDEMFDFKSNNELIRIFNRYKKDLSGFYDISENEIISQINSFKIIEMNPQTYNKDDYDLLNLEFIHVCAILRAQNYKLPEFNKLKTKVIAGKISASIVHSSCSIAGFILSNLLKQRLDDNNRILDMYFNMATNQYSSMKVTPKFEYKLNISKSEETSFSKWTFFEIRKKLKIHEFCDYLNQDFDCRITSIVVNRNYSLFRGKNDFEKIKERLIEDVIAKKMNVSLIEYNYFLIECVAYNIDDSEILMLPKFKYYLN